MHTQQLIDSCRKVFEEHDDQRIIAAFLYGSARDQRSRPDSDLDTAVLLDEKQARSWTDEACLMDELERVTRRPVDLRMLREGPASYQTHVLDNGITVYLSNENQLEQFRLESHQAVQAMAAHNEQAWASTLNRFVDKMDSTR